MIFVFTGNGKGKTTAAIGTAIRAVGAGRSVLMVQFLKTGSSENKEIKKIENFEVYSFGRKGFFLPESKLEENPELKDKGIKPLTEKDSKIFREGFEKTKKITASEDIQLLILDEIILGLKYKLIEAKEVMTFLKKYREKLDIILTGRYCSEEIIKMADLVTEMKEKKHPFNKGEKAKKGIEY